MDGIDHQAWKNPLRLRSEGHWCHEMSRAGPLLRDPSLQSCPQAGHFPSVSALLSVPCQRGFSSSQQRCQCPEGWQYGTGVMGAGGVLAAEVLGAEGWAKLQRGQGGCRLPPV